MAPKIKNKRRVDAGTPEILYGGARNVIEIFATENESKNRTILKDLGADPSALKKMDKFQVYNALNTDTAAFTQNMSNEHVHDMAVVRYGYEHKSSGGN
jgi:uncharacterized protein YbaP (TraB family)